MNSSKNSRSYRSKKDLQQPSGAFFNQKNWIGTEPVSLPHTLPVEASADRQTKENIDRDLRHDFKMPFQARTTIPVEPLQVRGPSIGNKSPVELMQDILRVVHDSESNKAFYSKEAEESLSELLTNRFKLTSYVKRLEGDMVGLDATVVKNYEILVLLLNQVSSADIEVRQGEQGMQLKFNRGLIQRQEAEIERLQKQKQEREKQIKYIIEEYQSIIFNFNDVIEKLVSKEDSRHKPKY